MFQSIYSARVRTGKTYTDYVSFGKGNKPLIMIPGLGDGLKTVRGMGFVMHYLYRQVAKDYKVYVISRKNEFSNGYTTRDMALDMKAVMESLQIRRADIIGISQGGMIAQHLAIAHPQMVNKLILVVSSARCNDTLQESINTWIDLAASNNFPALLQDTLERTYTQKYMNRIKPVLPLLSRIGKPSSFKRFLILADACLQHDAYEELDKITAPTLVIGGDADRVVGHYAAEELAHKITGSSLIIYNGLGHGAFDEAGDFYQRILEFLK